MIKDMAKQIIRQVTRQTLIIVSIMLAGGCFKDLGNYDYTEINDIVISDKGFSATYNVRLNSDVLKIEPEITFTKDADGSGSYSYEWVAVGQNFSEARDLSSERKGTSTIR